jgi:hypothetical protein
MADRIEIHAFPEEYLKAKFGDLSNEIDKRSKLYPSVENIEVLCNWAKATNPDKLTGVYAIQAKLKAIDALIALAPRIVIDILPAQKAISELRSIARFDQNEEVRQKAASALYTVISNNKDAVGLADNFQRADLIKDLCRLSGIDGENNADVRYFSLKSIEYLGTDAIAGKKAKGSDIKQNPVVHVAFNTLVSQQASEREKVLALQIMEKIAPKLGRDSAILEAVDDLKKSKNEVIQQRAIAASAALRGTDLSKIVAAKRTGETKRPYLEPTKQKTMY